MAGSLNGSLVFLLLKVLGQWRIIGGQVSHTDTINNNPIDITNKSSQDYRELLEGEGLQSRDISLEIYYSSDATYQLLRGLAKSRESADFRILRSGTGVNDDIKAVVSSFSEVAPMGDRLSNTITLTSTEEFSDAGPMPPIITLQPDDQNVKLGDKVTFITRAVNWTSVQWYRVGPSDPDTGERPERVEIEGEVSRDLLREIQVEDFGSLFQVVYSNAYGSAESRLARIIGELPNVAISNLYFPHVSDKSSTSTTLVGDLSFVGLFADPDDSVEFDFSIIFKKQAPIIELDLGDSTSMLTSVAFNKRSIVVETYIEDQAGADLSVGFTKTDVGIFTDTSDSASLDFTAIFSKG